MKKEYEYLKTLQYLINTGMPIFKTSENKEIFLVIGNLGAGKSTVVNYFIGHHMIAKRINGKKRVVVEVPDNGDTFDENQISVIGHQTFSQTLFSHSYDVFNSKKDFTFCDCPGFQAIRPNLAEKVCESMGIELSIRLAKKIRGVLVVIDYNEFYASRGSAFNQLINTLTKLFGNNIETACASLFFIITKAPTDESREEVKADLLTTISASINYLENGFSEYYGEFLVTPEDDNPMIIENKEQLTLLKLIQKNKDKFTVVDVLDNGESRNAIFSSILQLPSIPIELFDFKKYDDNRVQFNQMFYEIIDLAAQEMQEFYLDSQKLISLHAELQNYLDKIKFSQGQINFLQSNDVDFLTKLKNQKQALNEQIDKSQKMIEVCMQQIKDINNAIDERKLELETIDSSVPIIYWHDSIFETRSSFFGFLGWSSKLFDYKGIPIEKVEKKINDGALYYEKLEESKGIYTATYKSYFGKDGNAEIKIYVQSRNEPGNAKRIIKLKKDISNYELKRQEFFAKIREWEDEIKELIRRLNELGIKEKISEEEKQKQISQYEKEILDLNDFIKTTENKILILKEKQKTNTESIQQKTYLFESIENIIKLISFDSVLINAFLDEWNKYRASENVKQTIEKESIESLQLNTKTKTDLNFQNKKPRVGFKHETKFKDILLEQISVGLILGKAYDQGDCFFDALAQCMNQINKTDVNTAKYLRSLCHDFYSKNKEIVDQWNLKDWGGIDKGKDEYYFIQYTAEECERDLHGRPPIWGRSHVEGMILCHQLKLKGLCIIEILEDPETQQPVVSFNLVTKDVCKSISVGEAQNWINNPHIPTLVVEQKSLHFVPLLTIYQIAPLMTPSPADHPLPIPHQPALAKKNTGSHWKPVASSHKVYILFHHFCNELIKAKKMSDSQISENFSAQPEWIFKLKRKSQNIFKAMLNFGKKESINEIFIICKKFFEDSNVETIDNNFCLNIVFNPQDNNIEKNLQLIIEDIKKNSNFFPALQREVETLSLSVSPLNFFTSHPLSSAASSSSSNTQSKPSLS